MWGWRRPACLALVLSAAPVNAAERGFPITDFDEIRMFGPHRLTVSTARSTTVRAIGDRLALDSLIIESNGRILTIRSRSAVINDRERLPLTLVITVPRLKAVRLNGPGTVDVARLEGASAEAAVTGSGVLALRSVQADKLSLRVTGSAVLNAAGSAASLDAVVRGSATLEAPALKVADLKLSSVGPATTNLRASRTANVTATGTGTVTIAGNPSCSVQNLGTGTVACGEQAVRSGQAPEGSP